MKVSIRYGNIGRVKMDKIKDSLNEDINRRNKLVSK